MHYLDEEALGLTRSLESFWKQIRMRENRLKRPMFLEMIEQAENELDAIRGAQGSHDQSHPVILAALIRNLESHIARIKLFNTSNNPAYERDILKTQERIDEARQRLQERLADT